MRGDRRVGDTRFNKTPPIAPPIWRYILKIKPYFIALEQSYKISYYLSYRSATHPSKDLW